jgi:hypothetical protein
VIKTFMSLPPGLCLLLVILTSTTAAAANTGSEQPKKEMLRLMDFLREMEMLKQMEMMQDVQHFDGSADPITPTQQKTTPPRTKVAR